MEENTTRTLQEAYSDQALYDKAIAIAAKNTIEYEKKSNVQWCVGAYDLISELFNVDRQQVACDIDFASKCLSNIELTKLCISLSES